MVKWKPKARASCGCVRRIPWFIGLEWLLTKNWAAQAEWSTESRSPRAPPEKPWDQLKLLRRCAQFLRWLDRVKVTADNSWILRWYHGHWKVYHLQNAAPKECSAWNVNFPSWGRVYGFITSFTSQSSPHQKVWSDSNWHLSGFSLYFLLEIDSSYYLEGFIYETSLSKTSSLTITI